MCLVRVLASCLALSAFNSFCFIAPQDVCWRLMALENLTAWLAAKKSNNFCDWWRWSFSSSHTAMIFSCSNLDRLRSLAGNERQKRDQPTHLSWSCSLAYLPSRGCNSSLSESVLLQICLESCSKKWIHLPCVVLFRDGILCLYKSEKFIIDVRHVSSWQKVQYCLCECPILGYLIVLSLTFLMNNNNHLYSSQSDAFGSYMLWLAFSGSSESKRPSSDTSL